MFYLWIFGNNVEDAAGHSRFILFYLLSGVAAALVQCSFDPGSAAPMIGASGAVSGILGAYLLLYPRARVKTLIFIFIFITTVDIPAMVFLTLWFFVQIVFSHGQGVAWFAHIGGFLFGLITIKIFTRGMRPGLRAAWWDVSRETSFQAMRKPLQVLLINPYIYDVSAYSFWSAPLGLLQIGGILRENGMQVSLLDCLKEDDGRRKEDGRAPYLKERVETPLPLRTVGKRFKRYGLSPEEVRRRLSAMFASGPRARDLHHDVLVSGGRGDCASGAAALSDDEDRRGGPLCLALRGPCADSPEGSRFGGDKPRHGALLRIPGRDLLTPHSVRASADGPRRISLPGIRSVRPPLFRAASHVPRVRLHVYVLRRPVPLSPSCPKGSRRACSARSPTGAIAGFPGLPYTTTTSFSGQTSLRNRFWPASAVFPSTFLSITRMRSTPRSSTKRSAHLLASARFREVRLGLETIDPSTQKAMGGKVGTPAFERAVNLLSRAGFLRQSIRAYVLAGLPLQRPEDIRRTVDYASNLGISVSLTTYTPIPHTAMFEKYHTLARYPIADEPLFQNNALFPFAWEGFTEEHLKELKLYVRERNAGAGRYPS